MSRRYWCEMRRAVPIIREGMCQGVLPVEIKIRPGVIVLGVEVITTKRSWAKCNFL
jgi:hypothetical protein